MTNQNKDIKPEQGEEFEKLFPNEGSIAVDDIFKLLVEKWRVKRGKVWLNDDNLPPEGLNKPKNGRELGG